MALRNELKQQGEWLFRWRSYLPLLMLPILFAALAELERSGHRHDGSTETRLRESVFKLLCFAIALFGMGVRCIAVLFTDSGTSGRSTRSQRADSLNTTGMYSVTRHPLYFGNWLIGLGTVAFCQSYWVVALYACAFWIYYERIMYAEEEFLRGKFGESFCDWANHTPAFFPRASKWRRPGRSPDMLRMVRNECPVWFLWSATFLGLELTENRLVERQFRAGTGWLLSAVITGVAWAVVRYQRKKERQRRISGAGPR